MMGGKVYAQSDGSAIWSGFGDSQSDLISLVELSLLRRQAQMWRN